MKAMFTTEDLQRANAEWGCSCGPAAFAFACGLTLDEARACFPGFRGWTNTNMMKGALRQVLRDAPNAIWHPDAADMLGQEPRIARIEFTGPWTGTQWAAHHSHWLATWRGKNYDGRMVYDVNCGAIEMTTWEQEWLPQLLANHKRATGWKPTNVFLVPPGQLLLPAARALRAEKAVKA
jgi:hypothetical protein